MRISKFGHACLLIEEQATKILIDPGSFSELPVIPQLDAIFITHEHFDHVSIPLLKTILDKNPEVPIYTTAGVGLLLEKEGIVYSVVTESERLMIKNVSVDIVGNKHAVIYRTIPQIENFGVVIAESFFYPGDALTIPPKSVKILALPIAAPWLKFAEAIDYAIAVKPEVCFPTHDAILRNPEMMNGLMGKILEENGIAFGVVKDGESMDL
jgi:L-ascorbate metabolism protein UlaG (beta-lactamase superfamily)